MRTHSTTILALRHRGATVVAIHTSTVELERDGERFVLALGQRPAAVHDAAEPDSVEE